MKLLLIILCVWVSVEGHSQFTKASLRASGLTCPMCTKAVQSAIEKVSFVKHVDVDINSQEYELTFDENGKIDFDEIRKAVEDAGFSIASFKVTGYFKAVRIQKNDRIQIGDQYLLFLNNDNLIIDGERTVTVVDKNFLTAKEFKKFNAAIKQMSSPIVPGSYHVIM